MSQTPEKCLKIWIKLLEEIWQNKDSRKEFTKKPFDFLLRHDIRVPKTTFLKVHENTDQVRFLTLPQAPEKALPPEIIDALASGWGQLFFSLLIDYQPKPGHHFQPSKWCELVQRAWQESAFKEALLNNPDATLRESGFDLGNVTYKIHENTTDHWHLTLPLKPERKLTEKQLQAIAGGLF